MNEISQGKQGNWGNIKEGQIEIELNSWELVYKTRRMDTESATPSKFIYVNSLSASFGEFVLNSSIHSTNFCKPKCHTQEIKQWTKMIKMISTLAYSLVEEDLRINFKSHRLYSPKHVSGLLHCLKNVSFMNSSS